MKIRVVFAPDDNYVNKYPSGGCTVMQFSEKWSQVARQTVKHCGITATSTWARQDGMILSCLMAHCECGNWMLIEQYCSSDIQIGNTSVVCNRCTSPCATECVLFILCREQSIFVLNSLRRRTMGVFFFQPEGMLGIAKLSAT